MAAGLALMLTAYCGGRYRSADGDYSESSGSSGKVEAQAFLFDARLWRQGKPSSFRLEIYLTDSVTAMSGRGYLGKGALKGTLTRDTALIYFPTVREFVYEPVTALLTGDNCPEGPPRLDLQALLTSLPDSMAETGNIELTSDYSEQDRPHFTIRSPGCPWLLDLEYDQDKTGWLLRRFEFDNGQGTIVKGKRRTYKHHAGVPVERFEVAVPPDAERIIP